MPRLGGGAKLIIENVYGEFMAHPFTLTPQQRGGLVVCQALHRANAPGDRRDQVLALLQACGLRFRDGARWRFR